MRKACESVMMSNHLHDQIYGHLPWESSELNHSVLAVVVVLRVGRRHQLNTIE